MERSNSLSSNSSGPFGYQTRLLERADSTSRTTLSRSSSQASHTSILSNPTGGSSGVRKWAPSHRVSNSIDAVRGRWEERVREAAEESAYYGSKKPATPQASTSSSGIPERAQKRYTLPDPIVASPLSPNTTGVSVEADSPSPVSSTSPISNRIRIPPSIKSPPSSALAFNSSSQPPARQSPPSRYRRSNTMETPTTSSRVPTSARSFNASPFHSPPLAAPPSFPDPQPPSSPGTATPVRRRPLSLQGPISFSITPPISDKTNISTPVRSQPPAVPTPQSSSNVMSPPQYRSSYKKYGDSLTAGRRLGRHLPRIASGDQEDVEEAENKPRSTATEDPIAARRERREKRLRERAQMQTEKLPPLPSNGLVLPSSANLDDVAGVPGRIRLSKDKAAPAVPDSPHPSARLTRGLWADIQRHLIQAYEYLCHVGEAQQWIEGCLQEELPFGVVEMEEGLRNGVVLAKLVRVFHGENAVKKIYEAPKLDFRHSDNINHFFNFVRDVGLPECFIFELTDLYNKKNIPKVIYCIHALSHLLARRGMAQRIGNLLGQLEFSEEQLKQTQKGLKDSGVPMPNFSNIGRELAKEINEEEVETEEERRDRLLLEQEDSIIGLQAAARRFLRRRSMKALQARLRFAERHVTKFQAAARGVLTRRPLTSQRQAILRLTPWVVALQSRSRGFLARTRWMNRLRQMRRIQQLAIQIQAQSRGLLVRRRRRMLLSALRSSMVSVAQFQARARANVARNSHRQILKSFSATPVQGSVVALQATGRGLITRRRIRLMIRSLNMQKPAIIALQSQCRGVIARRTMRNQLTRLEDISLTIIRIQAAVRTYLARRRLLFLIRGLRSATPAVVRLQAMARGLLIKQGYKALKKSLSEAKTVRSVGNMQSFARAALARNRHKELQRHMVFVTPDVVGFQSHARGFLLREDYHAWRQHIWAHEHVATLLQALLRGVYTRNQFRAKMKYYRENLSKVVKIQSLFRAKETRDQYRQLTLGKNVSVGTIKNFVHLLDDSEADFQEEIRVERLRKKVVESIRENQTLENELAELDVKIALVVQNVKSFEDVVKSRRRRHGNDHASSMAARSLLAAHRDPFSGSNTADHEARRKLELYQQLFYLIQTHGVYLSRLFLSSSEGTSEKDRRFLERTALNLFGYGQSHREEYLLLKLFQTCINEEVASTQSIMDFVHAHPLYLNVAVQYVRPKQVAYVRDTLQGVVREMLNEDSLDLEADPTVIYRGLIDLDEMRTGRQSAKPKDVAFSTALEDPETRVTYIRHLQVLQWWTEKFISAIVQSTKRMPYGMRYLARETLHFLRLKFPGAPDEEYGACIGRLVFYRYLNTAIMTPETFEIVGTTVDVSSRKNLGQISRVLTQITMGSEFDDSQPNYIPINDLVRKAVGQMSAWYLEVANVPDAETQFHAHEFLDATVQPKPVYISPNEIYSMHSLLSKNQRSLAPDGNDPLSIILSELGGVPVLGSDELNDARDIAIALELSNRFAQVKDPLADEKALWVKAKRGVLAILRVQPGQDLLESLMRPVNQEDEMVWEDILDAEIENEPHRGHPGRQASQAAVDSAYRLEDIRSLRFSAVKALAISYILDLESLGKITRDDGFQGILNVIALDVRAKHRKRLQRQQEIDNMHEALKHLAERKKYFEEQINSYHTVVETSMNTMQKGKGKKRFVLPFTKQYFHMRDLQRSGQTPQFGSFLYTARHLYEKNILISIDKYSPRQYDKMQIIMSSNTAGVFTIVLESTILGAPTRIASDNVKIEDLLQAKYENKPTLTLFNGQAKFNFNEFLHQINKKFYI